MANSTLVGLLFEAWGDLDRVVTDLTSEEALDRVSGGSSYAWTYAHLGNMLDGWINARFQGHPPNELIGDPRFRMGGSGEADDWADIQRAVGEVRAAARGYLVLLADSDLDRTIPYDGSFAELHAVGLQLRYARYRLITHHYFHIGEIASKRDQRGRSVGDYPGLLLDAL